MSLFQQYLKKTGEYGEVVQIKDPLITILGLPTVAPFEIVIFESGALGQVFSIHENSVEVVLLTKNAVRLREKIARTDEFISVPVGKELLGNIIDPLGNNLPGLTKKVADFSKLPTRPLETEILGITKRAGITRSLATGLAVVDLMLPLGRGQKQLIIGDRKTGKTSFLLTTIKAQALEGSIIIYAAIGRKKSDIKKVVEFFQKEAIADKVITVASTSHDSPGLIVLTPFSAMSIAEYFRDGGQDVLVVFDDLTTHGKFYREMSLIASRFPGRESYPGDIFYIHSRLLERAGNFKVNSQKSVVSDQKGTGTEIDNRQLITDNRQLITETEVSITALPVVETIESDITGYIPTNVMSMTDGHIFFDQGTFAKGQRPAINIPLSVTRVGRQAQTPLKRDINHTVNAFLSEYEKMQNLAHFGAELSGRVQNVLKTGRRLFLLFNQTNHTVVHEHIQLVSFGLVWSNLVPDSAISQMLNRLAEEKSKKEMEIMFAEISKATSLDELVVKINQKKAELLALLPPSPEELTETKKSEWLTTTPTGRTLPGGIPPVMAKTAQQTDNKLEQIYTIEDLAASLGGTNETTKKKGN